MQLFYGFFAAILDDLRTPSGAGAAALATGALATGALATGALAASAASTASTTSAACDAK